jgi:hypothetical protein
LRYFANRVPILIGTDQEVSTVKTLRALKKAMVWNLIFSFSWMVSIGCFAIDSYLTNSPDSVWFRIGVLSVYGWMVNPMGLLYCVMGLKAYLAERRTPEDRQMIGAKWIMILFWPILTTAMWFLDGMLFVKFTGGV